MTKPTVIYVLSFFKLSLGIISIILCLDGRISAANFVLLGAVFIEGCSKMYIRGGTVISLMDKELDSISAMISFGIAPALCAWKSSLTGLKFTGYIILLLYTFCSAISLARNNITERTYTGIPITGAGALLLLDNISIAQFGMHTILTALFMLLLSYLMVSSIKIKRF